MTGEARQISDLRRVPSRTEFVAGAPLPLCAAGALVSSLFAFIASTQQVWLEAPSLGAISGLKASARDSVRTHQSYPRAPSRHTNPRRARKPFPRELPP